MPQNRNIRRDLEWKGRSEHQESNYKGKKIGWFDYTPSVFLGLSSDNTPTLSPIFGISFVSLNSNNTISLSLSSMDYSTLYRNAPSESIFSPVIDFQYHPNELIPTLTLFSLTAFYNKNYGGFISTFNPIIFNGYGNLPSVNINSKINHRLDYLLGTTLTLNKANLILASGYETTYKNTSSNAYFSANFNNNLQISYYKGYKHLDYNIEIHDTIGKTWSANNTDYVLKTTLQRKITFDDIYFGRKDGFLGINSITITPFATYFLSTKENGQKNNIPNNYQSIYIGLDNYFTTKVIQLQYDIGVSLIHRINLKSYNPQQYSNIALGFDKKEETIINLIFKFTL